MPNSEDVEPADEKSVGLFNFFTPRPHIFEESGAFVENTINTMADLGNLYFDVLLRDKTASEAAKIKKDILDALKADIDVNFDKAKLEADVRKAVQSVSGAISVSITSVDDTQLKALTSKVYDIKLNALLDDIADALQKAIEKKSYKIPISAKDLQTDIQSALKSGGFTVTATPNLLVSTIQAQINNSHGGKPYTVKLTADASDLANSVANAINGLGVKIVQVQAKANDLVKSIKDALTGAQPFKIDVVVDKATARQVVQQALSQVSTWNGKYTADDLRAAKAQAAQQVASAKAAEHHAKAQLALS